MARDILDEYGPDADKPQAARATCGGVVEAKKLPYSPPVGPIGIAHEGPGLGGHNCGNAGSQGASSLHGDGGAGAPGIVRMGGDNSGEEGSQHG
jgi:hypothetical protein